MANYKVTDTELSGIADAIRTKGGTQAQLEFPNGFSSAIANIPTGGGSTLVTKSITENGTYDPSDDNADGYSEVTVNVAGGQSNYVNETRLIPPNTGQNIAVNYRIIKKRVVTGFKNSHTGLCPYNGSSWIDIDWTNDWEIGCAFKVGSTSGNFSLFGYNNGASSNSYASIPGAEAIGSNLGVGISSTYNSWSSWVTLASIEADKWYFLKMSYDSSTKTCVESVTEDFNTWITQTVTLSNHPYHNSNCLIGFGNLMQSTEGSSGHTKQDGYIDLDNTYLKANDTMVWGSFTGSLPTDI